jgi:glutathionylspermidine synthase
MTGAARRSSSNTTPTRRRPCSRRASFNGTGWRARWPTASSRAARFCDAAGEPIAALFKLYPWEWLFREGYAGALATARCLFIEPPWKALLSNKGLLPYLWEMAPGHPNLLPAFFEGDPGAASLGPRYVRKPIYSREGANVTLVENGTVRDSDDGPYGREGFVLQQAAATRSFDERYPVLGSWLVASQPCGLGIREDTSPITKNTSRFVPHYIEA